MTNDINAQHEAKRRLSFDFLDKLVDSCSKGVCPELSTAEHYYLIDISAKGYILERAYYYWQGNIGQDDKERLLMSEARIKSVLQCKLNPNIKDDIFKLDAENIAGTYHNNAIKRKAYWVYLSMVNDDPIADYSDASKFVEDIGDLYKHNKKISNTEYQKWKKLWQEDQLHMVNGVDLFGHCFLRKLGEAHLEKITATNSAKKVV